MIEIKHDVVVINRKSITGHPKIAFHFDRTADGKMASLSSAWMTISYKSGNELYDIIVDLTSESIASMRRLVVGEHESEA
jgi:hypothetical protein